MKKSVKFWARRVLTCVACGIFAVSAVWAERVSEEDAAVVANNFMNGASASSGAKKAPAKRMVMKSCAPMQAAENQYYIYENANGEGWVMIAADDVVRPILAYSHTGHFRTDNMPRNIRGWLGGYNRQIAYVAKHRSTPSAEVQQEWARLRSGAKKDTATVVVAPLIRTGWGQEGPFSSKCPMSGKERCVVGCVATAMAQVMNYHQWPIQGIGSHTIPETSYFANFGATTYDWENMLDIYHGVDYTDAQEDAVATLMYHCGVAVDMEYGTNSSGAYGIDYNGYFSSRGIMCAETALPRFFGYDASAIKGYYRDGSEEDSMRSWSRAEWIAMLKDELDAARPIMYAGTGYDVVKGDTSYYGHSFICDGYDSDDYFHFNFGWYNICDGYYDVDAINTLDPGTGGGYGDFNLVQDVIVGIQPPVFDTVTVTWMRGNEQFATTQSTHGTYVLPGLEPEDCEGKTFVGWCTTADYSSETTAPAFVHNGEVLTADTCYAVFATPSESAQVDVMDTLTRETTGITGTSYGEWSNKTLNSSAVYAGQSAGSNKSIQLRSKYEDSGIITTASGGKIKKIVVEWEGHTQDDRTLDIYGKNSAYTSPSDLYDASAQGTLLGSITYGVNTEVEITGDYTFIGLRSRKDAMYLSSITITWLGSGMGYSDYTTHCGGAPEGTENIIQTPAAIKVLRDGKLMIIRGEAVYTITGIRINE